MTVLKIKRKPKPYYILGSLIILIIEIFIAGFVRDDFIRPYVGDFLVVLLLYCLLMAVSRLTVIKALLAVLLFSFAIEFFQLINIVKVMQYQPPQLIMILIGSSFSVWDLLAYTLGIIFTAWLEYYFNIAETKTGK